MSDLNAKLAKAAKITEYLINKKEMDADFAEAMGLYMVANNVSKIKEARMPVFLAGENGAAKFKAQLIAA